MSALRNESDDALGRTRPHSDAELLQRETAMLLHERARNAFARGASNWRALDAAAKAALESMPLAIDEERIAHLAEDRELAREAAIVAAMNRHPSTYYQP